MTTPDSARAQKLFATGLEHHRAGRFSRARTYYERGLRLFPGQPDALFLLGETHFGTGNAPEGERLMRQVIAACPGNDGYRRSLAVRLFSAGRFSDAQPLFEEALRLNPLEVENHRGLALTLERLERATEAARCWRALLEIVPTSAEALRRLAALLAAQARIPEAMDVIDRWLEVAPEAQAYALRADLTEHFGNTEADKARLLSDRREAVARAPNDALAQGKLALALSNAGQEDEALAHFDASVRLEPENATLHFNRGRAYARQGDPKTARPAYEAAVRLSPDSAGFMLNLANLYSDTGREDDARALYDRILSRHPAHAPALFNLGMLHISAGQRKDAVKTLEAALAASENAQNTEAESSETEESGLIAAHLLFQKMHLCEWDALEALARRVVRAIERARADIPPFITLSLPGTTPELQRVCATTHSARLGGGKFSFMECPDRVSGAHQTPRSADKRLRVGYLSSDFKAHATLWLMIEMLEAHDRARFEIFILSHGVDDGSPIRARLTATAEHFIDLAHTSEREAIAALRALELDVLVDLKGYTEDNRSAWLRYRLAPVQISWLGYPGTLGAPWVDYLIADTQVAPPEHSAFFSERLVTLPDCYQPNSRVRECAPASTRNREGLPENAFVLCSFNQTYKLTPELFGVWLDLLREFPETVLWLWASNRWAEESLRRVAEASGVASARLIFAEGRPQAEHLARLNLADLALDTFPYNGHTTTSDALWAGVPVVTLEGRAFASRVAASLLHAAGLPELIASDTAEYARIVRRILQNGAFRENISAQARAARNHSDLFDAPKFARALEAYFEQLCDRKI